MRKRIQLRGISRTPSDRFTADGGCSESLNVELDNTEIASVLTPVDITSRYGQTAASGLAGPVLFVHKGRNYENLIFADTTAGYVKAHAAGVNAAAMQVYHLQSGETVESVSAVGNTLIICTSQRIEYVLFKDGSYHDLGDRIPIPAIEFRTKQFSAGSSSGVYIDTSTVSTTLIESFDPTTDPRHGENYDPLMAWNTTAWNGFERGAGHRVPGGNTDPDLEDNASYQEINRILWDMISAQVQYVKRNGYFATPVFARFALRLFDGSYIYQSVPILVGASDKQFVSAHGLKSKHNNDANWSSYLRAKLTSVYRVMAYLQDFDFEGWEDIVSSIDIFLSTDIHNPQFNAKITGISYNESSSTENQSLHYDIKFEDGSETDEAEKIRNEILSKSIFYKIASFDVNKLDELESGYNLMSKKEFISQDYLVTQPTLPDDYMSYHRKMTDSLFRYNNKVMMTGVTMEISSGYPFLNGNVIRQGFSAETDTVHYYFKFYLRDPSNNVLTVMCRDENGTVGIVPYQEPDPSFRMSVGYAWIAYPDTRCFRVDVKITKGEDTYYRTYKMEEHPGLNCSFAFIGLDKKIGYEEGAAMEAEEWSAAESRTYKEDNVVWASLMDNPFVFPVEGRISFITKVLAIANVSVPLSTGQKGKSPLYFFTEDGIWTKFINEEGEFTYTDYVSGDVALSRKAIQSIEQAVVFISAQGVMLLEGMTVKCISENMTGKPFTLPEALQTLLGGVTGLSSYSSVYTASTPFNTFIASCKIAYDYTNRRLIFYDTSYAYVYRIETQTWHKLSMVGSGLSFDNALNSYPDCWIGMKTGQVYKLYDFSVEYDGSQNQTTLPGLVITRPFDLDEPDVRKALTALRIRGQANKQDVKYILLGSMDGLAWGILPSLRGGSYKLFRLVLIVKLDPRERMTWIDVDYETRFTNRMR